MELYKNRFEVHSQPFVEEGLDFAQLIICKLLTEVIFVLDVCITAGVLGRSEMHAL